MVRAQPPHGNVVRSVSESAPRSSTVSSNGNGNNRGRGGGSVRRWWFVHSRGGERGAAQQKTSQQIQGSGPWKLWAEALDAREHDPCNVDHFCKPQHPPPPTLIRSLFFKHRVVLLSLHRSVGMQGSIVDGRSKLYRCPTGQYSVMRPHLTLKGLQYHSYLLSKRWE
jgi:hypothetical protein